MTKSHHAVSSLLADRYLDRTARARGHKHTVIDAYNKFNMKFEVESAGQGGVLGGDNTKQAPVDPRSPPALSNKNVNSPNTAQSKPKVRKADRGKGPKPQPRARHLQRHDLKKREAEAAVWGAARMASEKQLRGLTQFAVA